MTFIHLTFAILASWRIAELFLIDRITARLRARFPSYLWQCSRCLSVWAGAWVTIPILLSHWLWWSPYLNWPFALSWLLFTYNDWIAARRLAVHGRQFLVEAKDGKWTVTRNELQQGEVLEILAQLVRTKPQQANGKEVAQ